MCALVYLLSSSDPPPPPNETSIGNTYEAQESLKTAYYRMRNKGDLVGSYELCEEAALAQFQATELECGAEMAKMLVESYVTDHVTPNDTSLARILRVISAFPPGPAASASPEKMLQDEDLPAPVGDVLRTGTMGLKWCRSEGNAQAIDVTSFLENILHAQAEWVEKVLGWRGGGLVTALRVQSGVGGKALGCFLATCATEAPGVTANEKDLFVSRGAISILQSAEDGAEGKLCGIQARACVEAFMAKVGPLESPLVRCVELLTEAVELWKPALVNVLLQAYHASLMRDPKLMEMVHEIREAMEGRKDKAGGLLGQLMSMFG